ncbi:MAG: hypothetical protein OXF02_00525 [Simkaniaceae bacterium]|nr:hypothetical protein [Simkaniaceae bacterium]
MHRTHSSCKRIDPTHDEPSLVRKELTGHMYEPTFNPIAMAGYLRRNVQDLSDATARDDIAQKRVATASLTFAMLNSYSLVGDVVSIYQHLRAWIIAMPAIQSIALLAAISITAGVCGTIAFGILAAINIYKMYKQYDFGQPFDFSSIRHWHKTVSSGEPEEGDKRQGQASLLTALDTLYEKYLTITLDEKRRIHKEVAQDLPNGSEGERKKEYDKRSQKILCDKHTNLARRMEPWLAEEIWQKVPTIRETLRKESSSEQQRNQALKEGLELMDTVCIQHRKKIVVYAFTIGAAIFSIIACIATMCGAPFAIIAVATILSCMIWIPSLFIKLDGRGWEPPIYTLIKSLPERIKNAFIYASAKFPCEKAKTLIKSLPERVKFATIAVAPILSCMIWIPSLFINPEGRGWEPPIHTLIKSLPERIKNSSIYAPAKFAYHKAKNALHKATTAHEPR